MIHYKTEPWNHQHRATHFASRRDDFALFFDMGTGKTKTAIDILRNWSYAKSKLLNTLILCPPIVIDQWLEEFGKHSHIPSGYIVPLKGSGTKRLATLRRHLESGIPHVYVTNYETLLMAPVFQLLLEAKIECLICDESHKLKSIKARRTKLAMVLADLIAKKLILTGTPILNTPMDIFSQYRILDGGSTFGKNFFVFRVKYFYDANAGMPKHKYFPNWKPRPGCFEQLNSLVYQKAMRVLKKDCLDLPPLVRTKVYVELSPTQAKAYKEMKKDLVTYLDSGAAVAKMALTKALRLQQIVSGFVGIEETEESRFNTGVHSFSDNPRLAALGELLDDLTPHHKVIVWASFHQNYKEIRSVLQKKDIDFVEIHGLRTEKQKREAIESFRSDDNVRVVLANQKSGGVGLNLIEASYSIYFTRTYSLEDDIQSEARNHRGGSEIHEKVTRIDLVAKDTIDEIILEILANKQKLSDKILDIRDSLR